MNYKFEIKQITVPLFGVVEDANQEKWLKSFSTPAKSTEVLLDEAAFQMIADDLGMDADGLAHSAHRYVTGKHRIGTCGLAGSTLGDLGEILTYLVNRAAGVDIVRVVSGNREGKVEGAENKFPQPDFIVKKVGEPAAALEVKSTQALDYQSLLGSAKWKFLQPCAAVKQCRADALPQLGYVGATLTAQQHALRIRNGDAVPFPIGKGIAVAVAAVDGRVHTERENPKFKTPPVCRTAARDCWDCLPKSGGHFLLTTMPNAPGMLCLAGAPDDGGGAWIAAYKRWSEALAARDLKASDAATVALARTVRKWLDSLRVTGEEARPLREFWRTHVISAIVERGLDIQLPHDLQEPNVDGINQSQDRPSAYVPELRGIVDEGQGLIQEVGLTSDVRSLSYQIQDATDGTETLSFFQNEDYVEVRMMSAAWWRQQTQSIDESYARALAVRLLVVSLGRDNFPVEFYDDAFLRRVSAKMGESTMHIGWQWNIDDAWHRYAWRRLWRFHMQRPWPYFQHLTAALYLGDPRIILRITDNGRAMLRIQKSVLN